MWAGVWQQAVASHTFIVRCTSPHISLFCRDSSQCLLHLLLLCREPWMRHASHGTRVKRKCRLQLFFFLNVRPTITHIYSLSWVAMSADLALFVVVYLLTRHWGPFSHTSVTAYEHSAPLDLHSPERESNNVSSIFHVNHFRQEGQSNATTCWPISPSQEHQASFSCLTYLLHDTQT